VAKAVADRCRRASVTLERSRPLRPHPMVIGAGAGGLVSAYIAAAVKAKVTPGGRPQDGRRLPELRPCAQQDLDLQRQARAVDPYRRTVSASRMRAARWDGGCDAAGAGRSVPSNRTTRSSVTPLGVSAGPCPHHQPVECGGRMTAAPRTLTTRNIVIAAGWPVRPSPAWPKAGADQ
jgi:hypothetical protein